MEKAKGLGDRWGKDNCLNSNYNENATMMREQRNVERKGFEERWWWWWLLQVSMACFLDLNTCWSPQGSVLQSLLFVLSLWMTKYTINYHLKTNEPKYTLILTSFPNSKLLFQIQQLNLSSFHFTLFPQSWTLSHPISHLSRHLTLLSVL